MPSRGLSVTRVLDGSSKALRKSNATLSSGLCFAMGWNPWSWRRRGRIETHGTIGTTGTLCVRLVPNVSVVSNVPNGAPRVRKSMDFRLTEEQKLIQNTAAQFVKRELLSREGAYLKQKELFLPPGDPPRRKLAPDVREILIGCAKQAGLWALELPESAGGSAMSMMARVLIQREFGRTILPFEPVCVPAFMADNHHVKEIVDGKLILRFAFDEVHKTGTLQSIKTRFREVTGGYLLSNATIDVIEPGSDLYLFPAKEEGTERAGLFLLDKNTPGV